MRIAIILPARLESTRLPEKLLLSKTGRPLIIHTAERAAEIQKLDPAIFGDIIVAADNQRIITAVEEWRERLGLPIKAVMTNPHHQSGSDRIAEAAASLGNEFDAILNLQGDEPEIDAWSVVKLAKFFAAVDTDIATMVYPITREEDRTNPTLVKAVLGEEGKALYFSRADIPYRRDGDTQEPALGHVGIYLYKRSSLEHFVVLSPGRLEKIEKLEQLRALENGMNIRAMILHERPAKGIDTPEDYEAFVKSCAEQ